MQSLLRHHFIHVLLCFALLCKVMVPAGFMPDFAAMQKGILTIKICTLYGEKIVHVDQADKAASKKDHAPAQKKSHFSFCDFAGKNAPIDLTQMAMWAVQAFSSSPVLFWHDRDFVSLLVHASWPRGPPFIK
jgi:hypothetical protein